MQANKLAFFRMLGEDRDTLMVRNRIPLLMAIAVAREVERK